MPTIQITDLSFAYRLGDTLALSDVTFGVEAGERCLLVGANGAGKTTLLRVIAGKHMIDRDVVQVFSRPAFHDTSLAAEVALLGGPFPFEVDVRVGDMVGATGADPRRRERLIEILDVDLDWHMHRISDGQRRRVQLLIGLLHPCRVLLLDEVTTDLDLVGRADLLAFLREETELRGACVLYATHIFDRMEGWASHIALLDRGRLALKRRLDELDALRRLRVAGAEAPLSQLVEGWLRRGLPSAS
jgi:CCR4-NOT complex subunit CAF16